MLQNSDRTKLAAGLVLVVVLVGGCRKEEKFPDEPVIAFKSLGQFVDSASYTITFTDGDGDVGLDITDAAPPFDTASQYYHNLFLEYDEFQNGTWTTINFALPLHYRIPRITPTGQNKALEGEIAVALKPFNYSDEGDTVRIRAYMYDRALNQSNTVTSEQIVVQ